MGTHDYEVKGCPKIRAREYASHPSPSASKDRGLGTLERGALWPKFGVDGIRRGFTLDGFVGIGGIEGFLPFTSLILLQPPLACDALFACIFFDRSPRARTVRSSSRSSSSAFT